MPEINSGKEMLPPSASPVSLGEVPSLRHEVLDDPVEARSLVAKAQLAGAEGAEVLNGVGHDVIAQVHGQGAQRGAIAAHRQGAPD